MAPSASEITQTITLIGRLKNNRLSFAEVIQVEMHRPCELEICHTPQTIGGC
jgi:hypothetical protein